MCAHNDSNAILHYLYDMNLPFCIRLLSFSLALASVVRLAVLRKLWLR